MFEFALSKHSVKQTQTDFHPQLLYLNDESDCVSFPHFYITSHADFRSTVVS